LNYTHKICPEDYSEQCSFEEFRDVLQKIVSNAEKFPCCAANNINENLNATMVKKAPE
jgi:hypothetical protein